VARGDERSDGFQFGCEVTVTRNSIEAGFQ
jgi:hypothetical protein